MNDLTHLKVGDLVAVRNRTWAEPPVVNHMVLEVDRLTATQIVVHHPTRGELKIRRKDGRVLGDGYEVAVWATPEFMEKHEAEIALCDRYQKVRILLYSLERRSIRDWGLNIDQLEELAALWCKFKELK